MNILVTGASGFVGSWVTSELLKHNHSVICCVRNTVYTKNLFPDEKIISANFIADIEEEKWLSRLDNIDIVINCVGIFYHPVKETIWRIHYKTPRALFDACVKKNVKKIIHISALGSDKYSSEYAKSKYASEKHLQSLAIPFVILKPSLIYGQDASGSMSLFRGLASLPLVTPVAGSGLQEMQPIHIADLAKAICVLVEKEDDKNLVFASVSYPNINMRDILMTLHQWLGFSRSWILRTPIFILKIVAKIGDWIPYSTLNSSAINMLAQNNVTTKEESERFKNYVGFKPRSFSQGVYTHPSSIQDRWHARLFLIKPVLRISLALIWFMSALCSVFLYSRDQSYHLLADIGVSSFWQPILLYGASGVNAILGLGLLINFKTQINCVIQIVVILTYSLIITWKIPQLWLEPFGAIVKNIPLLVAIIILWVLEAEK